MPNMHAAVHASNNKLAPGAINQISRGDIESLGPSPTLEDLVRKFKVTNKPATMAFLQTWPAAQSIAAGAAIMSALTRRPRMPVTLAWIPGYDYKVTISESAGIPGSAGEMTILLESRYPGDENNATERAVAAAAQSSGGSGAAKKAAKAPAKKAARKKASRRR